MPAISEHDWERWRGEADDAGADGAAPAAGDSAAPDRPSFGGSDITNDTPQGWADRGEVVGASQVGIRRAADPNIDFNVTGVAEVNAAAGADMNRRATEAGLSQLLSPAVARQIGVTLPAAPAPAPPAPWQAGQPSGGGSAGGVPAGAIRNPDGSYSWRDSSRGNPQPGYGYSQQIIPWTPEDYARYGIPLPGAGAGPGAPGGPAPANDRIIDRLMRHYGEDIGYLRGKPFSSTEEQQMIEDRAAGIRTKYETARQNLKDTFGATQGMSGPLMQKLAELEQAEAAEMSGLQRDLGIFGIGERRSRLGESRGILGGLESLERSRGMEALGVEQMLDEQERSRIMDLMRMSQGLAPDTSQAGAIGKSILGYSGELANQARQAQSGSLGGLGNLMQLYFMGRNQ